MGFVMCTSLVCTEDSDHSSLLTGLVSIDSSTGVIRLHRPIDRESLGNDGIVDIIVEAKDSGRPPPYRSATATVRITVTDINDNAPIFDPTTYDLQLYQVGLCRVSVVIQC